MTIYFTVFGLIAIGRFFYYKNVLYKKSTDVSAIRISTGESKDFKNNTRIEVRV